MSAPVPAPAAPAAAGNTPAAPAKPKSLAEAQREIKSVRAKPVQGPSQGSFVRVQGKNMGTPAPRPDMTKKPEAAAKAGAPAPVEAPKAEPVEGSDKLEANSEAKPAPDAKPDPFPELKKAFDAKSRELADLRKSMMEYEDLGKTNFRGLVEKLAAHYKADPRQVAEQLLLEHAQKWQEEQELAALSPEEREYRQLKKEKAEREVAETKAAETKAVEEKQAVERQSYEATTSKLIEAHKLLPESVRNHPEFGGRAAIRVKDRLMALALAADPNMPAEDFLRTVDPAKLASEAMAEYRAELRQALLASGDEDLDALLTPEIADRWTRKLQASAVKRAHPALTAQPRAGDGKFVKKDEKAPAKPLSAMKPAWANFLPKRPAR